MENVSALAALVLAAILSLPVIVAGLDRPKRGHWPVRGDEDDGPAVRYVPRPKLFDRRQVVED